MHDSFFELGGDSLLSIQVNRRLRQSLVVDLPLRNFLEKPTIADLAIAIAERKSANKSPQPLPQEIMRGSASIDDELAALGELSEDEVSALLESEKSDDKGHSVND